MGPLARRSACDVRAVRRDEVLRCVSDACATTVRDQIYAAGEARRHLSASTARTVCTRDLLA